MEYFSTLRLEATLAIKSLDNNIISVVSSGSPGRYVENLQLLRRYVASAYSDVESATSNTLGGWEKLLSAFISLNYCEQRFSDCLIRFYFPASVKIAYNAIENIADEILQKTALAYRNWSGDEAPKNFMVIFGGAQPYTCIPSLKMITLRRTDSHRLWNWGMIAHEIGHMLTEPLFARESDQYYNLVRQLQAMGDIQSRLRAAYLNMYASWKREVLADSLGILVAGPSLLWAHMMTPQLWLFLQDPEMFATIFRIHPPDEIRYRIMYKLLQDNGMGGGIDIENLLKFENMVSVDQTVDLQEFRTRENQIHSMVSWMWTWLGPYYHKMKGNVQVFSKENLKTSLEISRYIRGESTDLAVGVKPTEVLNGLLNTKAEVYSIEMEKAYTDRTLNLLKSPITTA